MYQPKPMRELDPSFGINTETFAEEVTFLFDIELKKDAPVGAAELTAARALSMLQRFQVPAAQTQDGDRNVEHRSCREIAGNRHSDRL